MLRCGLKFSQCKGLDSSIFQSFICCLCTVWENFQQNLEGKIQTLGQ